METWHNAMVQALMRKPPAGHKYVTIQQIMAADRELWSFLSQNTRGKLKVTVGQPPPLDVELETLRKVSISVVLNDTAARTDAEAGSAQNSSAIDSKARVTQDPSAAYENSVRHQEKV